MYPVTPRFLAALRSGYGVEVGVTARRGSTVLPLDLRVVGGSVDYSAGTGVRGKLSLDLAPTPGLWAGLEPLGVTLAPTWTMRYHDGSTERIPLGLFDLDETGLSYGPGGTVRLSAPDVWVRVQRARLTWPIATTGNAVSEAVRLAEEALGLEAAPVVTSSTATTYGALWERDRDDAVAKLLESAGMEGFVSREGALTVRRVPTVSTSSSVWTVDAGASGVLVSADRGRTRKGVFNVVVVSSSGSTPAFSPVTVEDTDPQSPTYISGPFGYVPTFYESPLITTAQQALEAGEARLARVAGAASRLSLTSALNPALEPGDVITVFLPETAGAAPVAERHVIETVSVPLSGDAVQSISTRTTAPIPE